MQAAVDHNRLQFNLGIPNKRNFEFKKVICRIPEDTVE